MKKFLFVILIGGLGMYLYQHPETWRQAKQISRDIPETIGLKPDTTVVYKWKDEQGNLMVTNTPPEEGIDYEVVEYRHDTNVVPAVPVPENKK